ncbi:MAG: hypothetical protein ACR2RL_25910 [Gammaproteobacteria bacterium]
MTDTKQQTSRPAPLDVTSVHAGVDRIILTHGAHLPIELLLAQGRLDYSAYEAWRTGEAPVLEDVLLGNPARIRTMLEAADDWARRLGLVPEQAPYEGWGSMAGKRLVCAREQALCSLLETAYRRRLDRAQADLFLDGGEAVALIDLRTALATRDAERAAASLDELLQRSPEHRLRPAAERLCDALSHLADARAPIDPAAELERLHGQLNLDARELLGPSARDFEIPFWRRLGHALTGKPFDPRRPDLHASYAFARCLDWAAVRECIHETPAFEGEPGLLIRLIEAEIRSNNRVPAIRWLSELCWRFHDAADAHLAAHGIDDRSMQIAWEALCNLDTERAMDAAWFPAWLLMAEPGLASELDLAPPTAAADAGVAFTLLRALLLHRDEGLDARAIDRRRQLRDVHPALLDEFLHRFT